MTISRNLYAMALAACTLILPATGSAEPVIGTALLSPLPYFAAAVSPTKALKPQVVAFNWLTNGAEAPSVGKAKAARQRFRVITAKGSWICSPAGFGQRSRCYAG